MSLSEKPTLEEIINEAERLNNLIVDRGGSQTITPKTSNQALPKGYYKGDITIKGDTNLVSSNIISGKSIFGVAGGATVSSLGGKKWASGTCAASNSKYFEYGGSTSTVSVRYIEITNLGFKPSIIIAQRSGLFYDSTMILKDYNGMSYVNTALMHSTTTSTSTTRTFKADNKVFVDDNTIHLPSATITNYTYDWIAIE